MKELTEEERVAARAHLEVIHAIQKEARIRHDYAHSPQFEHEFSDVEKLTYLSITKGILKALDGEVIKLAEHMGVDLGTPDGGDVLAQVIELFDGNRRIQR